MELVSVVQAITYQRDADRLLSEVERDELIYSLALNPLQGVVIKGTGGLRKMRLGFSGRGKRGGGRVIYWFHSEHYPIVLLALFAKNEASDLSHDERQALAKMAELFMKEYGG